jgi:hypothetical protein
VAGEEDRRGRARIRPGAKHRHAGSQHQRLGIDGQVLVLLRPLLREAPHVLAQQIGCLFEGRAHGGIVGEAAHHGHRL